MIVGVDTDTSKIAVIFDWAESVDDIMEHPRGMRITEAPDFADVDWVCEDGDFIPAHHDGEQYDMIDRRYYSHDEYRRVLHTRTSDDTLQALRKIREGDTSKDWQAWLDALDAYNVAIEETKDQEGYPLRVEYPEYPTKP